MDKNTIQDQIEYYQSLIQDREDTDPAYLPDPVKELRHKVMYVHHRVEQTLQIVLGHNVFRHELKEKNMVQIVGDFKRLIPIFDNMEFYSKVKAIQALDLMPKDLISLILKVNDHRICFSHPATYIRKIDEYKDPTKQLSTLKELHETLTNLDDYLLKNKLLIEK